MTVLMRSSRGSQWRKWDLHIHTPGTKKNDQYRSDDGDVWAKFCGLIDQSDVQAFGITDYFSADGYFAFINEFRSKYPDSTKIFFPNLELCTSDVVNRCNEEVNLHIIFNPFAPNCDQHIKSFLQNLDTNKTVGGGRHVKASELSTTTEFEEATTTREFIKKAFKETFGEKADLTDHLLIFTAANNDGIRTATEEIAGKRRGVKRKAVITDEVDKFSAGFFGNSGNTDYFLGGHRFENQAEKAEPKPVVSGSDAHSFADIENWLGKLVIEDGRIVKEPTWIKAELTFEGLKQILYEPAARVFIGQEPEIETSARSKKRRYIRFVSIDSAPGYGGRCGNWFSGERIEFNKELVAIIGNKGSGKSALTDILGLLGNSHNQKYTINGRSEELFSFLNADKFLKGRCASNFLGELHWYAGEPDRRNLDAVIDENSPENVEYLPQKYLEKICSNIEDDEFRQKLNAVIFGYVEENDRYGKTDLDQLIKYLANQTELDISTARSELHDQNEKVIAIEKKLSQDYNTEIEEKLRRKQADIAAHSGVRPTPVSLPPEGGEASAKGAAEIASIEATMDSLSVQIEDLDVERSATAKQVEDLNQARRAIERQANALSSLKFDYEELLTSSNLAFDDIVSLSVNFDKLDQFIEVRTARLKEIAMLLRDEEEIESLGMSAAQADEAFRNSIVCQRVLIERNKSEIIDQLDRPNREYQEYLRKEADWQLQQRVLVGDQEHPATDTLSWLQAELDAIAKIYPTSLNEAKQERDAVSSSLFAKSKSMVSFYNSVKKSIDKEIEKHSKDLGDYEIYIEASLRFDSSFYDEFFRYVSQAVKGSFQHVEAGKTRLKEILESVTDWQDQIEVFDALEQVVECLHIDKDNGELRDIFKQMKQQRNPVDLYDFLFGFEYLHTKYDLKVDGKDLSELSPGERGGLLLIFYLMLDRRDIPLIIDQPEDNLDNKSIYEILVTFLKKANGRRQIIMATHNPNLAVVADAEQIIHVSIDKKNNNDFNFYSGGIEDPEINRRAVDILEGTLPAFDNRRLKYRKQP